MTQHCMSEGPVQYPGMGVPLQEEDERQVPVPWGVVHVGAVQHLMSLDPGHRPAGKMNKYH